MRIRIGHKAWTNNAVMTDVNHLPWESPQPRGACNEDGDPHHFGPCTLVPLKSLTPSPLNQKSRTIHGLHIIYCASNILNVLHFQHPIDHRCLGQLCKHNWNRPVQESLRCRDRTRKFSRGYPRTAPRTREGIQGLSGRKSEANQLPQPGGECHPGVLGHSRRGGQPGKSHMPSGNSFNVTSSGPLPTRKSLVCWYRCPPLCSSLYYVLKPVSL